MVPCRLLHDSQCIRIFLATATADLHLLALDARVSLQCKLANPNQIQHSYGSTSKATKFRVLWTSPCPVAGLGSCASFQVCSLSLPKLLNIPQLKLGARQCRRSHLVVEIDCSWPACQEGVELLAQATLLAPRRSNFKGAPALNPLMHARFQSSSES